MYTIYDNFFNDHNWRPVFTVYLFEYVIDFSCYKDNLFYTFNLCNNYLRSFVNIFFVIKLVVNKYQWDIFIVVIDFDYDFYVLNV